ncbi:hypothetical protein GOODEAATRI_007512, partial [Goodea atripinnis]
EDDEAHEDPYCSIQVPHLGLMFENFSTDEDGEPHNPSDQRVESWKEKIVWYRKLSGHSYIAEVENCRNVNAQINVTLSYITDRYVRFDLIKKVKPVLWIMNQLNSCEHVCALTIGDKSSAGEHFAKHELDHGQDDTHQAADNGYAEQEVVLKEMKKEKATVSLCLLVFDVYDCAPEGLTSSPI